MSNKDKLSDYFNGAVSLLRDGIAVMTRDSPTQTKPFNLAAGPTWGPRMRTAAQWF